MFIRCRRSESTQLAISTCPSPIAWFNSQSIAISVPVLPTPALPQHHTRKHSRQTLLLICDALQSCIKYSGHKIFVTAQAGGSRRREGGMWGGGVSLPTGSGVCGGGCAPSPQIFGFLISKWWAFVHSGWYYSPFSCLFCSQKNGAFGLPKLKLTAACAHAEMERDRDRGKAKQK